MTRFSRPLRYTALALGSLVVSALTSCSSGGPGTSASVVTYEITSQGEGKVKVSYLKKVPDPQTKADTRTPSEYVAVEVVSLPWKKDVPLNGGSNNAFLSAVFDVSSIDLSSSGIQLPGLGSIQYSCSISALGKQVDQRQGTGTLTCQGPDAKKYVDGLE